MPIIRNCAITALPALLSEYYRGASVEDLKKQEMIVRNYIKELASTNFQVNRMGHALAVGCLPAFMLKPHLADIIKGLIEATAITALTLKWAESRRDAIKALTSICVTLEDEIKSGEFPVHLS